MTDTTTAEPYPQQLFSLTNIFSRLRWRTSTIAVASDSKNQTTDWLAKAAACALVTASAGFGAVYAWTTGGVHGVTLGSLSVLFAVALEVCKPLALRNALSALAQFNLIHAVALALLAVTAIAYSLTAELSLWATLRADGISVRQSIADNAANAKALNDRRSENYESIKSELASIAPARTEAEIQSDITKLFAKNLAAGDCSVMDGKVSRRVCPEVAMLRGEAARGKRREELTKALAATTSQTMQTPSFEPTVADPAANALSTYLAFLGLGVPVNILGEWLALIPVLALEVGSAFAGLLVKPSSQTPSLTKSGRRSPVDYSTPAKTPANTALTEVFTSAAEPFNPAIEKLNVSDDPSERLIHLLQASGGTVFGGQRTFAKAISVSPASVNGLLHDLKAAGRVLLDVGKNGTRVKLVAA